MMDVWLALVVLVACGSGESVVAPVKPEVVEGREPSILFVVVDGLRSDRVHGFSPDEPDAHHPMPRIQAWATGTTRFGRTYAASPRLLPSTASLLTGVPVRSHGVVSSDRVLGPTFLTLAQHLSVAGYATQAVVESHESWSQPANRLDRGFDGVQRVDGGGGSTSTEIVGSARSRWEEHHQDAPDQPLFLYVQLGDPLPPFLDHSEIDLEDTAEGRYLEELQAVDRALGAWLAEIEPSAVVVLTSSIGVRLDDREGDLDGLYEENIRVPTLIRAPRLPGASIPRPIEAIDVGSTVLGVAGIPECPTSQGRRLPQDQFGRIKLRSRRAVYSEHLDGADQTMGVLGQTKLIRDRVKGSWVLHELALDPREREDAKKGKGGNANFVKLQRAILDLERQPVFDAARVNKPQPVDP